MERKYLFNTSKIEYVRGKKPNVSCILCSIIKGEGEVEDLSIYKTEWNTVSLNLYPFNPGHLLIFPNRHLQTMGELSKEEMEDIHRLTLISMEILDSKLSPEGYNIGYNVGPASGASIAHLHEHVVPRFDNETGFLDVIAGARVVVIDPRELLEDLRVAFREALSNL